MLHEGPTARVPEGATEVSSPERPGRRFQPTTERLLDADLRSLASRLPGARIGLLLAPEFPGPQGVTDLLAVTRSGAALEKRLRSGIPFVTSLSDSAVLAALSPRRAHTAEFVARRSGMSVNQVRRRLSSLTARGMSTRLESGNFLRHEVFTPVGRSYSFEAKVSDWQQGLSQAVRYSVWSDASAVVLLKPPRDLSEVISRYHGLGIGLAVRDRWLLKPTIGRPDAGLRLVASELLAKSVSHQKPSPAA